MRKLLTTAVALAALLAPTAALAQSATPSVRYNIYSLPDGSATSLLTDQFGRLQVTAPPSLPYQAIPLPNSTSFPVTKTTAVASSLVLASGGNPQILYLNVVSGASAGYVMVFAGNSAPADGAVTPSLCYTLAANSTFVLTNAERMWFSGGVTVVFSTTGCFTKTASATAFIAGTAQ